MKMEPVSFGQLENMFTTLEDGRVSKELVDLHLKLLRRSIVKTVSNDSFEKYLLKYLNSTGLLSSEKRQLETYGYVHMSILSKLKILRTLCELQLDHNLRLRESIPTALRAMDMRDMVTGVDKNGLAYYCQIDSKYGLRLYTTEQDDESGYSWTLVARDMTDLENLIAKLKVEDLGYVKNPNDKRDFNKPAEGDTEPAINMVTKKGTYVDMFLDEATIKKMRESMIKEKEERRNRRNARLENPAEPQEEAVPEEEEKPVEVEEGDRRILPRRSASQKAQTNIRKYITPSRKSHEKKPNVTEEKEEVKEENVKRDSSTPASDDSEGSAGSSDPEIDGSASSDDEFKPKTPKKSTGKRRHRKKKVIEEEDDDESADEDEEEVRRRAEGDFACGSCKLSDNEEILLLCDNCDDAWHTTCLKPPLWFVPGGKWYCPKCEHGMLIECLTYVQEVLVIHQKKAAAEEKKRKAAADRFRREMEYIGVSLNNIIPTTLKQAAVDSSSSSSSDDGQRRSKKKAVKRITPNVRRTPVHVQTVAEGRSRRTVKKVDYKFSEFDSVIKEACRLNESPPPPDTMKEVARPQGGAGRGKDMANIIEAQKQREDGTPRVSAGAPPRHMPKHRRRLNDLNVNDESDSDTDEYKANESDEEAAEEDAQSSSDYVPSEKVARPQGGAGRGKDMANIIEAQKQREDGTPRVSAGAPPRHMPKHRRRLNDLNVNDESDSDTDEYKANESDEEAAEEDAQSSSDYVPSESELRKERAGGGGRISLKPTQSDEDFVVSGSDDSYVGPRRKKRKVKEKSRKRGRWQSDSESEEEDEEEDETYSDDSAKRKRKGKKRVEPSSEESNDELDDDLEMDEEDSDAPRTRTGRPLRKAVVKSKKALLEDSDDDGESSGEEDAEIGEPGQQKDAPPVTKGKKRKAVSDSESDVFVPDEDAENDDEDDEEIEEDEETSRETAAPAKTAVPAKTAAPAMTAAPVTKENNTEESEDSENDLELKPKPKKLKMDAKPDETSNAKPFDVNPPEVAKPPEVTKPAEAAKPLQVTKPPEVTKPSEVAKPAEVAKPPVKTPEVNSVTQGEEKPKPIPAAPPPTSTPKTTAEPAEVKPNITKTVPSSSSPTVTPSPAAVVTTTEEKPRVAAKVQTPTPPNPYVATTITTATKVPVAEAPPSAPTTVRPQAVPPAAPTPPYAAGDRSANVNLTPLVPNPYANATPLSQMPYCAGPQAAMPYAVANPYMPYPPNAPPFPPGPPPMGHPHIGYIPGVVPNPYGQQSSMPPSKSGTRDLRTL
nr:remodeling and spacing factor 1 [Haemonchus contortus]